MFMIKYLKGIGYMLLVLIISTLIITLMNYFDTFKSDTIEIFKIVISIFTLLFGGIYIGRVSKTNGYIEGAKIGLLFCLIIALYSFFGLGKFNFRNLFYYLILIASSMLGGMIGINKNKEEVD